MTTESIKSVQEESSAAAKAQQDIPQPQEWLELYGDVLYNFALRKVNDKEAAEDLVQDTLLSAVKGYENFQGNSTVKTWLFSIMKNKIIDLYRKQKRTFAGKDGFDIQDESLPFNKMGIWNRFIPNWAREPDKILADKSFAEALEGCMEKLPKRSKTALMLSVDSQYKHEEICKTLEISTSNLWVILHRARLKLRDCIDTNWYKK